MELLTTAAGDLLARLVAESGAPIGNGPGAVCPEDPALQELCRYGLVCVSGRRAVAVAPTGRLASLLASKQKQLMDGHRRLIEDYERLACLSGAPASEQVEILTSGMDISAALGALQAEAVGEYLAVDLLPLAPAAHPPPGQRLICTQTLLSEQDLANMRGWRCRIAGNVPVRMALSDSAALIMLSPTGAAAVVRLPTAIVALRHYFELLWHQATPLDGADGQQLTKAQRVILGMLLSGMADEAIARSLNVSSRSIRRQVASLELLAGVSSRFALGAAAVTLGWVDPDGARVR